MRRGAASEGQLVAPAEARLRPIRLAKEEAPGTGEGVPRQRSFTSKWRAAHRTPMSLDSLDVPTAMAALHAAWAEMRAVALRLEPVVERGEMGPWECGLAQL